MSVMLTVVAIVALAELVRWVSILISWGEETLPPPNVNDILTANYKPEECDEKMRVDCQNLLFLYFKEPEDAELYQRINEKMKNLNEDEKKGLLREITLKASSIMHVKLDSIEFSNDSCMGCYNYSKNSLMISSAYLNLDSCNVEVVKTIFHELKHAVQFNAISRDGNIWGYSDKTLITWVNNFQNYINCALDPEGYYHQPIEVDSFGYECSIIPQPGLSVNNNVA